MQHSVGTAVDEIYGRALAATKNRVNSDPWLDDLINHKRFDEYLLARCYERANIPFTSDSLG